MAGVVCRLPHLVGVVCLLLYFVSAATDGPQLGGDRTVDVVRSHGYNAEERHVVSEDGYILSVTHIKSAATKLPVLFMHGYIGASDQWVLRGPGKDLALILVDEGHDVWLADMRGNYFSHNHTALDTSQPEYWDFSFHEVGVYDLPALIDLVLTYSGSAQLQYIGYSMGTSVYYVLCSLRPEYNQVFNAAVHLSPVVYGRRTPYSAGISMLLTNKERLENLATQLRIYEFIPRTVTNQNLMDFMCSDANLGLCLFTTDQFYGKETQITNAAKLRKYWKTLSAGASKKTTLHLAQLLKNKNFLMYDYGKKRNYEVYGAASPPAYPLQKVTSPTALYYGDSDVFVDQFAINRLIRILPNNVLTAIKLPKCNHLDILFAEQTTSNMNRNIVKLLNKS